jgi:small GTP-binding protein
VARSKSDENKELKKSALKSVIRPNRRPKNARELGLATLKNLPANIAMIQSFMKAVNWKKAQDEVMAGLNNTIVIVGQANSGKSTLFNKMKGQNISAVSAEAGTTKDLIRSDFGPFTLMDTPGHLQDVMESGIQEASVVVLLLDATKGLQAKDRELLDIIKKAEKPVVIAVNKVDALKGGENALRLSSEMATLLGVDDVIPVSAYTGLNIAEDLIPDIIEASPEAAFVIGHELPLYRHTAAQRIIRNATLMSLAAGLEPIPLIDIPILLGIQTRLVLRLAALYGEPLNSADAMKHAKELVVTMVGGLGLRYLAEQAAKLVPFGGDFVAGAIAGAATWSIGQVALQYYEGGKQVTPKQLRQQFFDFYKRFRKQNTMESLRQQAIAGDDKAFALEESNGAMITEEPA